MDDIDRSSLSVRPRLTGAARASFGRIQAYWCYEALLMAEGHTIHRIARDHNRWLAGRALRASSPQGRFRAEAARLDGDTLERAEAYGKNLFHVWRGGAICHVHLGMAGRFTLAKAPARSATDQVRLRLESAGHVAELRGPMRCALITEKQRRGIIAKLGPDVLRDDADPNPAWERIRRTRKAVGALLLDQGVIAGVGNIYRCEALFLTGVAPERPGDALQREEFDALWVLLRRLMRIGVRRNRILTLAALEPERASHDFRFYVYKRPACLRCGHSVRVSTLAGRTVYACPECQR